MVLEEAMETPTVPAPQDVMLSDGSTALVRAMERSDEAALLALHDSITDRSLRMRFFAVNRKTGHDYVRHLVEGTGDTLLTLVVLVDGELIGEATAERVAPDTAEVALLVADAMHGHGVGTILLEQLARACQQRGIEMFVADVLSDNAEMFKVIDDLGLDVTRHAADGVVSIELRAPFGRDSTDAADTRDQALERDPVARHRRWARSNRHQGSSRPGAGAEG
jgi:GNAT superfamily N-acetyltransferase